jgi:DNA-directed RNA polymerase subunit RPC12/RpoP
VLPFRCPHCSAKLTAREDRAGRTGRCPKCKSTLTVPPAQTRGPAEEEKRSDDPEARLVDPAYDTALLDIAPKGELPEEATSRRHPSDGLAESLRELTERFAKQEAGPVDAPKLHWPIDVILYPLNITGLIHLVGLWLLLFLVCPFIMSRGLGTEFVPVVYALPVSYTLYYFAECIRDRVAGGRHVPNYWMHPGDSSKWDCLTQAFEVVGCVATCFWPVSVYYIVREQVDWIYWLLLAGGGFFFPMVLLAVVLFDSLSGLNPILIGESIVRTFVPYCGLVLLLCGGAILSAKIGFPLNGFYPLPMVPFLLWLAQLYMIFIAIALLGDFYRRYKDRLDWGI